MKELSLKLFQDTELIPIVLVSLIFCTIICLLFHFIPERKTKEIEQNDHDHLPFIHYTQKNPKYTNKDIRNIILVTGVYAIVSMWNLGTAVFPVTTWQPVKEGQDVVFALSEETAFDGIYTIYGEGDNNSNPDTYQLGTEGMLVYGSNDHENWEKIAELEKGSIYEYQIIDGEWDYKYVWLHSSSKNNSLTEFALRNDDHFVKLTIDMDGASESEYPGTLLIDEQDKLVITPTYEDEGYFDEIYHPRNAWEIANGQYMYATVHPLFGTNTMALFIKLFGMSPFVWRLPGAIFGILLVPLFYVIARRLFQKTSLSTIASVLLAGDFMHLTTSRIGTLEPFSVFWILVMFYFMIRYIQMSWYDTPFKKQFKYLGICGITMGIAIATKWTACYSAVGLAILLFAYFFQRFTEYLKARKFLNNEDITQEEKDEAMHIAKTFPYAFWMTVGLCFLFFIFIPIIIYALSYLPDKVWKDDSWSLSNVWDQVMYMYNYHIDLDATHPYSSTWDQWLLDIRPIWYYNGYDSNSLQHTISCFSNPLMTWTALITIIFSLIDGIRTKSHSAFIICIGYITALAPWIMITRCVFSYHFYPTSFFAILSIVYFFRYLEQKKTGRILIIIYLIIYIGLFLAFLPATAGFGTTNAYIKSLEWFETWYFG